MLEKSQMLVGFAVLFACQLIGEILVATLRLPVPGPVMGMALLAIALAAIGRVPGGIAQVADALLKAMPLFFVPAGVGVLVLSDTLRASWLPITAALLGSTLLAVAATAFAMKATMKVTLRLLTSRARQTEESR